MTDQTRGNAVAAAAFAVAGSLPGIGPMSDELAVAAPANGKAVGTDDDDGDGGGGGDDDDEDTDATDRADRSEAKTGAETRGGTDTGGQDTGVSTAGDTDTGDGTGATESTEGTGAETRGNTDRGGQATGVSTRGETRVTTPVGPSAVRVASPRMVSPIRGRGRLEPVALGA